MPKKSAKKSVKKTVTTTVSTRGGARKGAGRPKGSGKYGCATKAVRIPIHLEGEVQDFVMKKVKAEKKAAK